MDVTKCALTTIDNPYDPFDQFTEWMLYDEEKGYHSTSYLGRIARTSDELSDEENDKEIERAIDEIIKYDFRNIYKKVKKTLNITQTAYGYRGCIKTYPHLYRGGLCFSQRKFFEKCSDISAGF